LKLWGLLHPIRAAAWVCAVAIGCGAGPADEARGPGPIPDGSDGGFTAPDAGEPPPPSSDEFVASCQSLPLATADENGDAVLDCNDSACRRLALACCIGEVTEDCCLPDAAIAVDSFGSCDGAPDLASCLSALGASATTFGAPTPSVDGSRLLMQGDATGDSGVVVELPLDPTVQRVRIQSTIAWPDAASCGTTCIDAAGIALTTQTSFGSESHVSVDLGVLASTSRSDLSLLLGGEIVRSWHVDAGSHVVALVVDPNGGVQVEVDGVPYLDGSLSFVPRAAMRVVLYGRNYNPSSRGEIGAGFETLSIAPATCDIPTAWAGRAQVLPGDGAIWDTGASVRDVTVATDDAGKALMIFETRGAFFAAVETMDGTHFELRRPDGLEFPALEAPPGSVIRDPELVFDGGVWRLYYTLVDASGKARIFRATSPTDTLAFVDPEPTLDEAALGPIVHVSSPAVLRGVDGWTMVVHAERADGWQGLVRLASATGLEFGLPDQDFDGATIATTEPDRFAAFARDEISGPDLLERGGAFELYYAGRRGTRWAVGLLVSNDLVAWRALPAGEAMLEASGSGFDAMGVTQPAALVRASGVDLFYTAIGAERSVIGRALRAAPGR